MQTILITGANRGIGLALTRHILSTSDHFVFATCRSPEGAEKLNDLAQSNGERLQILPLDVNDAASIQRAVDVVESQANALDLLINNAGVSGDERGRNMGQLRASEVSHVINSNAVSALILTQACLPLLKQAANPRVAMISSGMGSIANAGGSSYAYRMSKAAMNMAARVLSLDAALAGITTVAIAPGWVRTDMGGPSASLSPEESASAVMSLANGLNSADNGKFYRYDGAELAW